jgi:hypothetical protein
VLLYLIKYTSGVDGAGQTVERYGAKREDLHRQITKGLLQILHNNRKFHAEHFKATK